MDFHIFTEKYSMKTFHHHQHPTISPNPFPSPHHLPFSLWIWLERQRSQDLTWLSVPLASVGRASLCLRLWGAWLLPHEAAVWLCHEVLSIGLSDVAAGEKEGYCYCEST